MLCFQYLRSFIYQFSPYIAIDLYQNYCNINCSNNLSGLNGQQNALTKYVIIKNHRQSQKPVTKSFTLNINIQITQLTQGQFFKVFIEIGGMLYNLFYRSFSLSSKNRRLSTCYKLFINALFQLFYFILSFTVFKQFFQFVSLRSLQMSWQGCRTFVRRTQFSLIQLLKRKMSLYSKLERGEIFFSYMSRLYVF